MTTVDSSSVGGAQHPENRDEPSSIAKALRILDALTDSAPRLGLAELARRSGVPKTTALRMIRVLVRAGYLERVGDRYQLSRKLFVLGNHVAACRPSGLRDVAVPYLMEIYERTHEIVHLAILSATDVLYVEKVYGRNATRCPTRVGGRVPATCTALGKAMLAFSEQDTIEAALETLTPRTPFTIASANVFIGELEKVKSRGTAYDMEEVLLGLTCVAAPVLKDGRAVAAISVAGPSARLKFASVEPMLVQAAAEISRCRLSS